MRPLRAFAQRAVRLGRSDGDGAPAGSEAPPRVRPVSRPLYVEAEPRDRSVGTVRGYAIAFACRKHGRETETYVLVDDPSKPAVVWLKESEIRLHFPPGLLREGDHGD